MPVVILSIFVSLLPRRWRGYWLGDANVDVRRGAVVSAVVQFVACCATMWALYPAFIHARLAEASAAAATASRGDKIVEGFTVFAYGPLSTLAYIFRPLTILLLYFALEGAARIVAAVACDEVLPTLPLLLIARAHELGSAQFHEYELGPRVADLVEPGVAGKYDLKVSSCRPKDWNSLVTIRHNNRMYELRSEETGTQPRPFVYLLRLKPESKIIRGLRDYDPEEPLRKPGWAEVPGTPPQSSLSSFVRPGASPGPRHKRPQLTERQPPPAAARE